MRDPAAQTMTTWLAQLIRAAYASSYVEGATTVDVGVMQDGSILITPIGDVAYRIIVEAVPADPRIARRLRGALGRWAQ